MRGAARRGGKRHSAPMPPPRAFTAPGAIAPSTTTFPLVHGIRTAAPAYRQLGPTTPLHSMPERHLPQSSSLHVRVAVGRPSPSLACLSLSASRLRLSKVPSRDSPSKVCERVLLRPPGEHLPASAATSSSRTKAKSESDAAIEFAAVDWLCDPLELLSSSSEKEPFRSPSSVDPPSSSFGAESSASASQRACSASFALETQQSTPHPAPQAGRAAPRRAAPRSSSARLPCSLGTL
eukprot:CAMPEP_0173386614 /NCGR_PEP_ID=MMETSP1356-20130122/9198_1 /TAXON_ID=77927 ORGANISM="Hemiselmis virescens, Strain PCC157" /NCGR_SAMPLE_ID=MMETSP1356 /ASSEMBLY_ACC=CAM_ASM_000847 /LENGTH=235 /DNA_ID=CAMNT_0014342915 /DNA_START=540 /DNA_END=1245 /DNA_ORIENTATION=-